MVQLVEKGNGAWEEKPSTLNPACLAAWAMTLAVALPSQNSLWVW